MRRIIIALLFLLFAQPLLAQELLYLRDNLARARDGDYLVTVQGKNYTLLHVCAKDANTISFEEITVPSARLRKGFNGWKVWVAEGAPGNTSWVLYKIDLASGRFLSFYSFTNHSWYDMASTNPFLSQLLNLKLEKVPEKERRRVGVLAIPVGVDKRPLWAPRMIIEGQEVPDAAFNAWRTRWPEDHSELSGKWIEVYLPQDNQRYPSYFPYWLQISGMIGSAKVRIIDSGAGMRSPALSETGNKQQPKS